MQSQNNNITIWDRYMRKTVSEPLNIRKEASFNEWQRNADSVTTTTVKLEDIS